MEDNIKEMMENFLQGMGKGGSGVSAEDAKLMIELLSNNDPEIFGLSNDYVPPAQRECTVTAELREKLDRVISIARKEVAPKSSVPLKPVRGECTVFDSKLGGTPYFPKNMEYPTVREGNLAGRPLRLLAQLNFGTLPHIDGFPEKGILQFFAGCDDDDVVGIDFDNYLNQNGFRVIYHEQVLDDISLLIPEEDMPQFDPDDYDFPFKGEFLLKPSAPEMNDAGISDFMFINAVVSAYNSLYGTSAVGLFNGRDSVGLFEVDEKFCQALCELCSVNGTRIGGYPYFTQEDPRGYNEDYAKCDTLLFQLDSDYDADSPEDEIMWGDCGVGNFFISAEDLKNLDFSRVLYTWDCC